MRSPPCAPDWSVALSVILLAATSDRWGRLVVVLKGIKNVLKRFVAGIIRALMGVAGTSVKPAPPTPESGSGSDRVAIAKGDLKTKAPPEPDSVKRNFAPPFRVKTDSPDRSQADLDWAEPGRLNANDVRYMVSGKAVVVRYEFDKPGIARAVASYLGQVEGLGAIEATMRKPGAEHFPDSTVEELFKYYCEVGRTMFIVRCWNLNIDFGPARVLADMIETHLKNAGVSWKHD